MNSHLRRVGSPASPPEPAKPGLAKITDVRDSTNFVLFGDSVSLDITGPIPDQWESGQLSFEVNDKTQAPPALRHNKDAANIVFVDGHAATITAKTFTRTLKDQPIEVKSWESEWVNAGGTPVAVPDKYRSAQDQGLRRNPNMELVWSQPGLLHR